jgi:hypothetical protein
MPRPGTVDQPGVDKGSAADYEVIRPDMTDAERRAAVERAKQRERERAAAVGSGSAAIGSGSAASGSGSAASGSGSAANGSGSAASGSGH